MAPRRTKGAGKDNRCPTLKLIMVKGPLSGQTSEFSPRSVIRIGRVPRGNTLAIKDDGVSSKHLKIQVEETPDFGQRRWTITDLGSSNGTFLNGELLESSTALSDGDVIIIGEQTSIKVEFEGNVLGNEVSSTSTRKNVRRQLRDQPTDLGVIDELGFGNKKDEKKNDDAVEIDAIQSRNVSTKGTKSSQESDTELKDSNTEGNKDLGQNGVKELPGVRTRRTRNSRKENDDVVEIDAIQSRNVSTKGSKSSQESDTELKDSNAEGSKDLGQNGIKELPGVRTRRTRNSSKEGGAIEAVIDLRVIEGKRTRGRKKEVVETIPEETKKEEENVEEKATEDINSGREDVPIELGSTSVEEKATEDINSGKEDVPIELGSTSVEDKATEDINSGKEDVPIELGSTSMEEKATEDINSRKEDVPIEVASTSGVKENNVNIGKGKMVVDLETMTMGEWLDFMEVYLPQQIIEESEAKIAEMQQTAKRFNEFMVQQRKLKG